MMQRSNVSRLHAGITESSAHLLFCQQSHVLSQLRLAQAHHNNIPKSELWFGKNCGLAKVSDDLNITIAMLNLQGLKDNKRPLPWMWTVNEMGCTNLNTIFNFYKYFYLQKYTKCTKCIDLTQMLSKACYFVSGVNRSARSIWNSAGGNVLQWIN